MNDGSAVEVYFFRAFTSRQIAEKHQLTYGLGSQFLEALWERLRTVFVGVFVFALNIFSPRTFIYVKSDTLIHHYHNIYTL
jgi:hypothetical protein